MQFWTRELLQETKTLPTDQYSSNEGEREFENETDAKNYLADLKMRLIDLSHWNNNSGLSSYALFDRNGLSVREQQIKPGLFLRIDLHGSGKPDWVSVEDIFESADELVITVKPTYDPTAHPPKTGEISHFFSAKATNNFCCLRDGNKVSLYVIGLNETVNSGHTSGILETVRNTAVANLGYYLGIQKSEWTKFCESFLADRREPAKG